MPWLDDDVKSVSKRIKPPVSRFRPGVLFHFGFDFLSRISGPIAVSIHFLLSYFWEKVKNKEVEKKEINATTYINLLPTITIRLL